MGQVRVVLVGVIGLLFAVLGVRWMLLPAAIAAEQGLGLEGPVAFNTARGDIGGLFVAGAILCGLWLRGRDGRWLQALALLVGCVAFGRVLGMLLDGFATMSAAAFAIELAMIAILLGAARSGGEGA